MYVYISIHLLLLRPCTARGAPWMGRQLRATHSLTACLWIMGGSWRTIQVHAISTLKGTRSTLGIQHRRYTHTHELHFDWQVTSIIASLYAFCWWFQWLKLNGLDAISLFSDSLKCPHLRKLPPYSCILWNQNARIRQGRATWVNTKTLLKKWTVK